LRRQQPQPQLRLRLLRSTADGRTIYKTSY